ncbi:spermidine synthase [Klebsiella pneumoniae]|uniref:Spermidine synthase n=1 Tax=Klebsiella pneumoniae TaxID=573 RepID=A0A447RZX8_KLEPN|nr:spermidine synthase [Klebsiella pneumoniae]
MMTHVPLLAHGNAKHVLIIGGGDGADAARSLSSP